VVFFLRVTLVGLLKDHAVTTLLSGESTGRQLSCCSYTTLLDATLLDSAISLAEKKLSERGE
jgi:hypothetical protein